MWFRERGASSPVCLGLFSLNGGAVFSSDSAKDLPGLFILNFVYLVRLP